LSKPWEKLLIVVAGASGNLGQAVAQELGKLVAPSTVRLATRTPDKLAGLSAKGFETVRADYDDRESLARAFDGAQSVLIISALEVGSVRKRQHRNAITAAEKAGVKHLVYTSMISPHPTVEPSLPDDNYDAEAALAQSKLDSTILRYSIFTDALVTNFLPGALQSGRYVSSTGKGAVSYVARADCARVTASVLAKPPGGRWMYEVTGPEAISAKELVRITQEVTGRALKYVAVSSEEHRAGLVAAGLPAPVVGFAVWLDHLISQGYLGIAAQAVREITGLPPLSVRDFLKANRAALVKD
jgi:NAD(P)H dehydrogenase (quinone)